jgi:hypothetical protein
MRKIPSLATSIALWCVFSFKASATVIMNDAAIVPFPGGPPDQLLTLTQSIPVGQGMFAFRIAFLGSDQFRFTGVGAAEASSLFAVNAGDALDPAFALSHTPLVTNLLSGPNTNVLVFTPNQSILIGYWDDRNFNMAPDANDNYGWVNITRAASLLQASSSATAIGGGIIVGTTMQIPEPASVLLVACGMGLIFFRRAFRVSPGA